MRIACADLSLQWTQQGFDELARSGRTCRPCGALMSLSTQQACQCTFLALQVSNSRELDEQLRNILESNANLNRLATKLNKQVEELLSESNTGAWALTSQVRSVTLHCLHPVMPEHLSDLTTARLQWPHSQKFCKQITQNIHGGRHTNPCEGAV